MRSATAVLVLSFLLAATFASQAAAAESTPLGSTSQGEDLVGAATEGRRTLASSSLAGAAARSRRELRGVTAAENAAASRQLLQTAPFTQAEVEKIIAQVVSEVTSSPPPPKAPYGRRSLMRLRDA